MTDEATGKLELLPNPCTTKPCLPGLALAVVSEDRVARFLTRNGRFYMQPTADLPSPGERVVVVGTLREQKDVDGKSFQTIEVSSVKRL